MRGVAFPLCACWQEHTGAACCLPQPPWALCAAWAWPNVPSCFYSVLLLLVLVQGQEPVVGLDVAQFCSSTMRLPRTPSDPPPATCRPRSLQALLAARAGSAAGVCDRDSMCSREWDCVRWDGEVTLEELRAQRPAPLFYISLAFLVSLSEAAAEASVWAAVRIDMAGAPCCCAVNR
jgi:hypothetical protein